MTTATTTAPLTPVPSVADFQQVLAQVNLRRDIHLFVDFVRENQIKRSHRSNGIPKGPATRLAKILSYPDEGAAIEEDGEGFWSDKVSFIARDLGLVKFDVEGVYAGYSSTEPSFPDNYILVEDKRVETWLASDPLEKERSILTALEKATGNEFFRGATLIDGDRFDSFGSATGPASRMDLPRIRRGLLELLAELPTGVWLPSRELVSWLRSKAPTLILHPKLRDHSREVWGTRGKERRVERDNLYQNFRERTVRDPWGTRDRPPIPDDAPDGFARVEGRYLQFFLQEIPYLMGFVDLAFAPEGKKKPDHPVPPLEPLAAVRFTPRLRQVVRGDPELSRVNVTVMPNFEVMIDAPSYPDRERAALDPFCRQVKEDGPTHVLELDRKRVVELMAGERRPPQVRQLLERLSKRPLPENVASEIEGWCGHAEKLTVYDAALIELRGSDDLSKKVRAELGDLVLDGRGPGLILTRDPDRTVSVLEQRQRMPVVVAHRSNRFAPCDGPLAAGPEPTEAPEPSEIPAIAARRVTLTAEDLVGYRSKDHEVLAALKEALERGGSSCLLLAKEDLLLVPATDLPKARAAFRRLKDRFDVELSR